MAVLLAEAAVMSTNQLVRGVIETWIQTSPVLNRLPFMDIEGNALEYKREATLPGAAFRAVNAGYTESTGTFTSQTAAVKILGGDADVDVFIAKTRGNVFDQRALQSNLKLKAIARKFTETFFEGDSGVDANSFDGLRTMVTGGQVASAGTNGAALTLTMLDDLLALLDAPDDPSVVLWANAWLIRKINALVRATGGTVAEPLELYGRRFYSYAGVLLAEAGLASDNTTQILGFDETQGSSSLTGSIYATRLGEGDGVAGIQSAGGIDVRDMGELETKPAYRLRVEWYPAIAIFATKAAARLKGILQA